MEQNSTSTVGPKILAISTLKGGVGKSTTTMMISDALSLYHEKRVLIVDLDPQANVSQMVLSYQGLENARSAEQTITNWVEALGLKDSQQFFAYVNSSISDLKELSSKNTSVFGASGNLSIVPSTPELRFKEIAFDQASFDPNDSTTSVAKMVSHLKVAVSSMGDSIDVVIFDCPPSFSTFCQAALKVSHAIISPTLEEPLGAWSLKAFREFGLRKTLNNWSKQRHRVLYTRVSRKGAIEERRDVRNSIQQAGFQPMDISIKESAQAHRWVQRPAAKSIRKFATKYGTLRASVKALGNEVIEFLESIPNNEEKFDE